MKTVIIGATGLIGSQVKANLEKENQVIAASPSTGVNTLTGEGLDAALQNADVVIDVSNSPSFEDKPVMDFFSTSTGNIIASAKKAGVKHYIILSVVGTKGLQGSGYMRAKLVQEDLVKASGIPFTIVEATQFFEFASGIVYMSTTSDGKIVLPKTNIQPIASADVARFISERAVSKPINATIEIAGPQKWPMHEWISEFAKRTGHTAEVTSSDDAKYSGATVTENSLGPNGDFQAGKVSFEDWFAKFTGIAK
ncbi:SDR family oxidoreductase [Flavobacterium sp.]|uniref:SDR family oxidoreductase n=1 Tax=Flavobacterium sp. TaxID=239 RepID=UPI00122B2B13|nr:NAD(P)H-binding protein [Flavobacterium sp.]RZJ72142.1 MAG: NmrA family transcriptional regulator [Flavobacterium sp.]